MFERMRKFEWEYIGGVTGEESWREREERKYDKRRDKKAQRISKIN